MEWHNFTEPNNRNKLYGELRAFLNQETYDRGEWSVFELLTTSDKRKLVALMILTGDKLDGRPDHPPRIDCRLKVLSRQACSFDKDKHRIWIKKDAIDLYGEPGDLLPEYNDPPQSGDVIVWKGEKITHDPHTGAPIDPQTEKSWTRNGKSLTDDISFTVDKEQCITVDPLTAMRMLQRNGVNSAKPRFRKVDKRSPSKRRIVNWLFKEVRPRGDTHAVKKKQNDTV